MLKMKSRDFNNKTYTHIYLYIPVKIDEYKNTFMFKRKRCVEYSSNKLWQTHFNYSIFNNRKSNPRLSRYKKKEKEKSLHQWQKVYL